MAHVRGGTRSRGAHKAQRMGGTRSQNGTRSQLAAGVGKNAKKAAGATKRVTGEALKAARRQFQKLKPQAWIDEAAKNPSKYTSEQLARMKKGMAPVGPDGFPMEIHHRVPLAEGGSNLFENFEFLSRTEHRLGPNYKINHPNLP